MCISIVGCGRVPMGYYKVKVEQERSWRSATGRPAVLVPVPLPGKLGRALRAGGLTAHDADVLGQITFAEWLSSNPQAGA